MSSPPPRSRFTYRDFHQLAKYSVDTPLRVITHIDLDAFYAQCEMKRIGVGPEVPLAVQQWQNLIAVNYAARPSGVTRHITAKEATDLCPELKLVHVAVWKAGEEHWSYSDTTPDITTCKACLDPYRAESKKILAVFKAACPDALLEKAGIDESFLDLSKVVHDKMLEDYEVLRLPPPYNDPLESLPLPDQNVLDWCSSHLVASEGQDHEVGEIEVDQVDWDDIAMAVGARMVRFVRDEVKRELGYTCSAGISSNKMIAKLGSGYRKPNQQSIVRPLAIKPFLDTFEFIKIRNLGGKLGTQISEHFSTTSIPELLQKPLSAFQSILSDDTATWVYNVIRGIDKSPLTPRSAIKSMLSAKSFRPPSLPQNSTQALPWLKVFCADIFARIEDDSDPVPRRPKGMTLNFTSKSGISRGRQAPIPAGGTLDKEVLFRTAEMLLKHHIGAEGPSMWPLIRLSMNVSGFEEKEPGNVDIGAFLVRGQQAVELRERQAERTEKPARGLPQSSYTRDGRKRVLDPGISRFFGAGAGAATPQEIETDTEVEKSPPLQEDDCTAASPAAYEIPTFPCEDCGVPVPIDETDEHRDWHFAKYLQQQDRENNSAPVVAASRSSATPAPPAAGKKRKGRQDPKLEKGQKKLAF